MDLAKYQELTGNTVSEADTARYTAVINRVNATLESALGYSLDPDQNLDITELGKVQFQGALPLYPIDVNNLLPPDTATGTYRMFRYNDKDLYIKTDPFTSVYAVKLVQVASDDQFITICDLTDYTVKRTRKFGKYVEKQLVWFTWQWYSWLLDNLGQDNGLQVAVDGDWADEDNIPNDLLYLWTDMIDYYSSDNVSVTGNIKSESVNGHSWSVSNAGGGKGVDLAPEQSDAGLKTIAQYAGPNGNVVNRIPTI